MLRSALFDILSFSQTQIVFLGPLEWRNLFGQKSKVVIYQKLIKRSGIRFLILFVLMDAILLRRGLHKRPKVKKILRPILCSLGSTLSEKYTLNFVQIRKG